MCSKKETKNVALKIGNRFGNLTVLDDAPYAMETRNGQINKKYKCKCDCGNIVYVIKSSLTSGNTVSCGCSLRHNNVRWNEKNNKKEYHGDGKKTSKFYRLYMVWAGIKKRCYLPTTKCYKYYGGKGIKMCKPWLRSYLAFKKWALETGYNVDAPIGQCTIDRVDANRGYYPSNCRWVSMKEQNINKRKNN